MLSKVVNFGVYSLHDKDVEEFGLPFVAENDSVAVRNVVGDFIQLDDVVISSLTLVEIGQFDSSNGVIESYKEGCFHVVKSGEELLKEVIKWRHDIKLIDEAAEKEINELLALREQKNKESN